MSFCGIDFDVPKYITYLEMYLYTVYRCIELYCIQWIPLNVGTGYYGQARDVCKTTRADLCAKLPLEGSIDISNSSKIRLFSPLHDWLFVCFFLPRLGFVDMRANFPIPRCPHYIIITRNPLDNVQIP